MPINGINSRSVTSAGRTSPPLSPGQSSASLQARTDHTQRIDVSLSEKHFFLCRRNPMEGSGPSYTHQDGLEGVGLGGSASPIIWAAVSRTALVIERPPIMRAISSCREGASRAVTRVVVRFFSTALSTR